jgi:hypothetical protein
MSTTFVGPNAASRLVEKIKAQFAAKDHTHYAATTTAAGMMSAADKAKLDGVAAGANAYSHPTHTAGTAGTSAATSGASLSVPYVTYDGLGHVTASGTHTHTVTGFAATSHGHDAADVTSGVLDWDRIPIVPISQTEYDALTTAEQNDGRVYAVYEDAAMTLAMTSLKTARLDRMAAQTEYENTLADSYATKTAELESDGISDEQTQAIQSMVAERAAQIAADQITAQLVESGDVLQAADADLVASKVSLAVADLQKKQLVLDETDTTYTIDPTALETDVVTGDTGTVPAKGEFEDAFAELGGTKVTKGSLDLGGLSIDEGSVGV